MRLAHIIAPFFVLVLAASAASPEVFEDSFHGKIAPEWKWRDEQPGAWRVSAAALEMRAQPGNLWGGARDARNLLLRPLPPLAEGTATDVTVTSAPAENYEQAGLLWLAADANYVKLVRERLDGRIVVNFVREEGDQPRIIAKLPVEGETVLLRLAWIGGEFVAQYRLAADVPWQLLGKCAALPAAPTQVGLATFQGFAQAERWVKFTAFRHGTAPQ